MLLHVGVYGVGCSVCVFCVCLWLVRVVQESALCGGDLMVCVVGLLNYFSIC